MPPSTPPTSPKRQEYDTIRRVRFFNAFDRKKKSTSLGLVCRRPKINIPTSTARTWLKKREILGSPALRRTRRTGSRIGPKPLVSAAILETITDQENPIHEKSYEEQVQELGLACKPSTLQHHATQAGARRFKKDIRQKSASRTSENGSNMVKTTRARP